ncbi:MAG TPA: hypothetical protein VN969_05435 [Streptosporangiaceae bacterium]|nr:hypothetical protein [Streptosporangiaceae bacterium]
MAEPTDPAGGTGSQALDITKAAGEPPVMSRRPTFHMIAFRGHRDAEQFIARMHRLVNGHRAGWAHDTIVNTEADFIRAIQIPADFIIVSAHGLTALGGGTSILAIGNEHGPNVYLSDLAAKKVRFGATAGIFWDVCGAGRPPSRAALAGLAADHVVHIAPIRKMYWADAVHVGDAIVRSLVIPGSSAITPDAVAAVGAIAAASGHMRLWHAPIRLTSTFQRRHSPG